jgi:LysR family transcriptional activator of dmlA
MNFNHLKLLISVIEHQGFSAAARHLHISPTAISKQIKILEGALGIQLIQRSSTKFSVTEGGYLFYAKAKRILNEVDTLTATMQDFRSEPSGDLKLFSSIAFGEQFIVPHLKQFTSTYPSIILKLELSDRIPDIQAERIDLCLGLGGHWDGDLIQKQLFKAAPCLLASPAYVQTHGEPKNIADLSNHKFICHSNRPTPLTIVFNAANPIEVNAALFVNTYHSLLSCALDGLGITCLYDFIAKPFLEAGRLKQLLLKERMPSINYYGFFVPTYQLKPSARAMLNFIQQKIQHTGKPSSAFDHAK